MLGRFLAGVQVRVAGVDQQGNFPVGGRRSSMSPPPGGLCRVGAAQGFRGGVGNGLAIATAIVIASLVERETKLVQWTLRSAHDATCILPSVNPDIEKAGPRFDRRRCRGRPMCIEHGKSLEADSIKRLAYWAVPLCKWSVLVSARARSDRWYLVEASHKSCTSRLNL